jgi:histidinol dehydrogenase
MNINFIELASLSIVDRERLLRRSEEDISGLLPQIQPIIDDVRSQGDVALHRFNTSFGGGTRPDGNLRVPVEDFRLASERLDKAVKDAVDAAARNIRQFHNCQMTPATWMTELSPGVIAGERITPIASVGLYVPRGKGAFPSVMLMLGIPAAIARVPRIVVCTPPAADGSIDDATLYSAQVCGIEEVYAVGGAHAIAALAFGTHSVPKVAKILGPGSKYVSAAKRLLYGKVDVGLPAGPSESVILCDEKADARLAAYDLLIEAEHGPDSAALLVTHSQSLARAVQAALPDLVAALPEPRKQYCVSVLSGYGGIVLTTSLTESIRFVNDYAPEHLEILVENPFEILSRIQNAGEILLGPHCPITVGNYVLGVNAILPTGGFARTYSCTTVHDYLKRSSFAHVTREGFESLSGPAKVLADFEGFPAHYNALAARDGSR